MGPTDLWALSSPSPCATASRRRRFVSAPSTYVTPAVVRTSWTALNATTPRGASARRTAPPSRSQTKAGGTETRSHRQDQKQQAHALRAHPLRVHRLIRRKTERGDETFVSIPCRSSLTMNEESDAFSSWNIIVLWFHFSKIHRKAFLYNASG